VKRDESERGKQHAYWKGFLRPVSDRVKKSQLDSGPSHEKAPRPPRVKGVPLFGNTFQFLKDTSKLLDEAYRKHGPVFRLRALWLKYTVVGGFEAKRFLQEGLAEKYLSRHQIFDAVGKQLGNADFVLGQSGPRHVRFRRLLAAAYSREVASQFVPDFIQATRDAVRIWAPGEIRGVMKTVQAIAFEQYCRAMCSRSLKEYYKDCCLVTEYNMNIGGRVWPFWMYKMPSYQAARQRVLQLVTGMALERRNHATGVQKTIMDTLLTFRDKDGSALDLDEVVCYSMYGFAGSISYMGRVIAFMLYEILKHPGLHRQLVEEVDHVFADGVNGAEDIRRMELLGAVYKETLRFHPVSQGMPFYAEKHFVFEGKKICPGDLTVLSQVPMSFSDSCFPNPHRFDHRRMLNPGNENRGGGAFHPFGIGHRTCTATGLVELMALTMVAVFLHQLEFQVRPAKYQLSLSVKPLPAPNDKFKIKITRQRTEQDRTNVDRLLPEEQIVATYPGYDQPAVREALKQATPRTYGDGEVIIRQGEAAETFYIIEAGTARVTKARNGAEEEIAVLHAGEYFGEIGLLCQVPRTATVIALGGPLEVIELSRPTFLDLVTSSDFVSGEIAAMVRKRIAQNRLREAIPELQASELASILPEFTSEMRTAGEVVIRQGEDANRFYIVADGEAIVSQRTPENTDQEIARLTSGQYFGEIGLLQGCPRTATVRISGHGPATLLSTDRQGFNAIVGKTGGIKGDLAQAMLRRMSARA
jgi:cytochrome P450/CRP-like cAMP-binding protein